MNRKLKRTALKIIQADKILICITEINYIKKNITHFLNGTVCVCVYVCVYIYIYIYIYI